MKASLETWIVTGVHGGKYPYKLDIFEKPMSVLSSILL